MALGARSRTLWIEGWRWDDDGREVLYGTCPGGRESDHWPATCRVGASRMTRSHGRNCAEFEVGRTTDSP
jgi:hypothetical protein